MVLNSVKEQQGTSLIELLVSASLGLVVLLLIGNVYLNGQHYYLTHMQRLLLAQEVNGVMRFIKEEMQRAGFNGINDHVAVFVDTDESIHITNDSVRFIYQMNTTSKTYRGVVFLYQSKALKICSDSTLVELPSTKFCSRFYSLFDTELIEVTEFSVKNSRENNQKQSTYLSIVITARLINSNHTMTSTVSFNQRH